MRALFLLPLALACLAAAQTPPRLDTAQAVDIRVLTIDWHPLGSALLNSREEETGVASRGVSAGGC